MKKENKLNKRGFTLIEVLAVIVILVIIVSIAIPNISASLDRQTCKTTENKAKLIESAAQFYVSDNRNHIINTTFDGKTDDDKKCKITTDTLKDGYITKDDLIDGNNKEFSGYVMYDNSNETYTFCFINDSCDLNPKDASDNDLCVELESCK